MALWFSTGVDGAGLRLELDIDSALDVGAASVRGADLSPGAAVPQDGDPRIDRALKGFLFTCGPEHIRLAEPVAGDIEARRYPLHGSLCGTKASGVELSETAQGLTCCGHMTVLLADGGQARVQRRWSSDYARGTVTLQDRVENTGTRPFAPMLMYHMNLGTAGFGSDVRLSGNMLEGGGSPWHFDEGERALFCVSATETAEEGWAHVGIGPLPALSGRSLAVRFRVDTLPYLQVWRTERNGARVLSIEPASHRLAPRAALATGGEMPLLLPGETVAYMLEFSIPRALSKEPADRRDSGRNRLAAS